MAQDISDELCEQVRVWMLEERGVTNPCHKCQGFGTALYPSTATWRGGVGGMTITTDVCDACWGSGDEFRHWPSHRLLCK